MKNLLFTIYLCLMLVVPLLTSCLLSWSWIQEFKVRMVFVIFFMVVELITIALFIIMYLKSLQK